MRRGKVLYDSLPHPFRFTIAKDSVHSEEVRKCGEAYGQKVETFKAENATEGRKQRRAESAAAVLGVSEDFVARHPDRILQADEMRRKIERLRAEEEA
jgi:LmbE family N-acetylglucosaminyl deacetylase